jgi:hypothetical protein
MHFDHYGGMNMVLSGLLENNITIGGVYDRTAFKAQNFSAPDDDDANGVETCFNYEDVNIKLLRSDAAKGYVKLVKEKGLLEFIDSGKDLLGTRNYKNISMFCVAAYGAILTYESGKPGKSFFIPEKSGTYSPKSENDLSYAFLLSCQGFHYYTAGDLGGNNAGNYSDGETPVTDLFQNLFGSNFHLCAMKTSHHGSKHSTSPYFVQYNNPTIAVIPASLRTYGSSQDPLPTKSTIDNLNKGNAHIAYCFIPKNPGNPASYYTKGNLDALSDISLTVTAPGTGDVTIHMDGWRRDATTLERGAKTLNENIVCNKNHTF